MTWTRHIRSLLMTGFFLFASYISGAQAKLQITVPDFPRGKMTDSIFLAGNINGWNPADSNYRLSFNGNVYKLTILDVPKGDFSFKFTRGNWGAVESGANGQDVANRVISISGDTSIISQIAGWKDLFDLTPSHTASPNVHVISDSIWLPELGRKTLLRIYVPESYGRSKQKYPVLYMHDGQNLFDDQTSFNGEWGIDECLDSLIRQGQPPCIVVGIDNGPRRNNEYMPFASEELGEARGAEYMSSLVRTIKPYIDKKYRTLKTRENTIIAGSSLGGLISYYALLTYPDVFGHAGIFSPAFWIAPAIYPLTDSLGNRVDGKCFFYIGDKEGKKYRDDMVRAADKLGSKSSAIMYSVIDPEGVHKEVSWRKWFPEFYVWMMGNGFNRQIKTKQ